MTSAFSRGGRVGLRGRLVVFAAAARTRAVGRPGPGPGRCRVLLSARRLVGPGAATAGRSGSKPDIGTWARPLMHTSDRQRRRPATMTRRLPDAPSVGWPARARWASAQPTTAQDPAFDRAPHGAGDAYFQTP